MNFVIFNYTFLPEGDAEAFCTARFANALAEAGHQVQMVTMEWEQKVSQDICREICSTPFQIHRIPRKEVHKPIFSRLRYLTHEWYASDVSSAAAKLKEVLQKTENPILISRGNPAISHIVAWQCRKYAKKWIVHFSDPNPWFSSPLNEALGRFWGRRYFQTADKISLTCEESRRFFRETYGKIYEQNRQKVFVTTHIGDPLICPSENRPAVKTGVFQIAHCGALYDGRYISQICRELQKLRKSMDFQFVVSGEISSESSEILQKSSVNLELVKTSSPRQVSNLTTTSSVNLVVDLKTRLKYCPFLPSKFVYLLYTDIPIAVYSTPDSCMARLTKEYPEAGIYFADVNHPGELADVFLKINKVDAGKIDRRAIRQLFTPQKIAAEFIKNISE